MNAWQHPLYDTNFDDIILSSQIALILVCIRCGFTGKILIWQIDSNLSNHKTYFVLIIRYLSGIVDHLFTSECSGNFSSYSFVNCQLTLQRFQSFIYSRIMYMCKWVCSLSIHLVWRQRSILVSVKFTTLQIHTVRPRVSLPACQAGQFQFYNESSNHDV